MRQISHIKAETSFYSNISVAWTADNHSLRDRRASLLEKLEVMRRICRRRSCICCLTASEAADLEVRRDESGERFVVD